MRLYYELLLWLFTSVYINVCIDHYCSDSNSLYAQAHSYGIMRKIYEITLYNNHTFVLRKIFIFQYS